MKQKLQHLSFGRRWTVRIARWIFCAIYRIRVHGSDNVPKTGGVIVVPNHISWLDGLLMMTMAERPMRAVVFAGNFGNPLLHRFATSWDTVLMEPGPKKTVRAIREIQAGLRRGDGFLVWAAGGISRNGQLQSFRRGLMKMTQGTNGVVVPAFLDELWGSVFSHSQGKFFWKWPKRWRYPISIHYGKPLSEVHNVHTVRQAVQQLGASAVTRRQRNFVSLPLAALRRMKQRKFRSKFADSNGTDVTGLDCLIRILILRRLLRRHLLAQGDFNSGESRVGVLLPPSVGAVMTNLALAFDCRTTVNLNYTLTSAEMNHCIATAQIQHVITSRQVVSKLDLDLDAKVACIEDFRDKVTIADKVIAAVSAALIPTWCLARLIGIHKIGGDDLATLIFTSGSTGTPKGVELTYDNIASNVEAIDQVIHLTSKDVVLGVLPFFHSFGYTVTLWTPAALDLKAVYHYSPIDGKRIGRLAKKHKGTLLIATPTFLRNYIRRCSAEQFATLDVVVAGAEKLPQALSDAFEKKFGVRPVEGYGCTELSPLACVNIPPSRSSAVGQLDAKEGTVGRPIPNVAARIVHPETGVELDVNEEGMLLLKGPNVMQGYHGLPERTAKVVVDGWYTTGDIGLIDEDGFIRITGRQSRFSKIGGEMVPHIRIEEAIHALLDADEEAGPSSVVTAVPDEARGERLVVLHVAWNANAADVRDQLLAQGIPKLFVPAAEDFHEVDQIPTLGTGKLDFRRIQDLALEIGSSE